MTNQEKEIIDNECEANLREISMWYGGWDEVKKVIDRLEENDNEAAYERYSSGGSDAWSGGFADNH